MMDGEQESTAAGKFTDVAIAGLASELEQTSAFHITVEDPQLMGGAMTPFIMYTVYTKTSEPHFQSHEFTSRRRYRDFDWLARELAARYPGAIVPPLPEKTILNSRFSEEFVEKRRVALGRFLRRVALHPILSGARVFHVFLEASEDQLDITKGKASNDKRKVRDFMQFFKETAVSLTNTWAGQPQQLDSEQVEFKTYVDALDTRFNALHKYVQNIVSRRRDMGDGFAELGLSLQLLGDCDPGALKAAYAAYAACVEQVGQLETALAAREAETLGMAAREYCALLVQVQAALAARANAFVTYQTAQTELDSARAALHRVAGTAREAATQEQVAAAEAHMQTSKEAYHAVAKRTKSELKRFEAEKTRDVRAALLGMVHAQVKHAEETARVWAAVLPKVEAIAPTAPADA